MNPHQKNKVDITSLSTDEQRLFRLYGKLPNKKDLLQNKLKERKYFDSGDYALSKAGKASDSGMTNIGTEHPSAETIPHMSPLTQQLTNSGGNSAEGAGYGHVVSGGGAGSPPLLPGAGMHRGSIQGIPGGGLPGVASRSPVKESSFLARTESVDQDADEAKQAEENMNMEESVSPPAKKDGIPIRR